MEVRLNNYFSAALPLQVEVLQKIESAASDILACKATARGRMGVKVTVGDAVYGRILCARYCFRVLCENAENGICGGLIGFLRGNCL